MDSRQLIDVQFNRAVEIVQSLPKTGPIQTGYEDKLTMYSLYKQATVGNVTTSRPGMFDMLGRAKWDAWAKHKDLDQYEAKCLYIDALLKALGKYSDKTVARDLIDELRSYGGGSENLVLSYTSTRARSRSSSSSSTSTTSADNYPISLSHQLQHSSTRQQFSAVLDSGSSDDGEVADESRDLPTVLDVSQQRPLSSISFSSRYRTPRTGSLAIASPPLRRTSVPPVQPLPNFETQSAFADPQRATSAVIPSVYSSSGPYTSLSSRDLVPQSQSTGPLHRSLTMSSRHSTTTTAYPRPLSQGASVSLEHAMENMQAHLAALTERIDTLESTLATRPQPLAQGSTSSRASSGRGSPAGSLNVPQLLQWDIDDMGLWTLVLKPLFQNLSFIQRFLLFFLRSGQERSPLLIIVRRLCLDISFVVVLIGVLRTAWVQSGTRRKEVGAALIVLWGAVTGKKKGIPRGGNLRL